MLTKLFKLNWSKSHNFPRKTTLTTGNAHIFPAINVMWSIFQYNLLGFVSILKDLIENVPSIASKKNNGLKKVEIGFSAYISSWMDFKSEKQRYHMPSIQTGISLTDYSNDELQWKLFRIFVLKIFFCQRFFNQHKISLFRE